MFTSDSSGTVFRGIADQAGSEAIQAEPFTISQPIQSFFAVANYKDKALFISGGMKIRSDCAENSVIKLDVQTKEATEFKSMNHGRFAHASTVLGSKLYVIWGSGGTS